MAARFGDMLLEQRRRMGLSIQQVANTIKIRPQIIEFFENGNFASMPPRGYAQGRMPPGTSIRAHRSTTVAS